MGRIVKLVKYQGYDLPSALIKVAEGIPSGKFKSFLVGLRTVILSGTPLYEYLKDKSESELFEYKRTIESVGDLLSMLNEVYMIVIAFGVTLGIILGILMASFIGDASMKFIMMVLVAFIPIISFVYIILMNIVLP